MKIVRIENWSLQEAAGGHTRLSGLVHGHPNFEAGTLVNTSRLVTVQDGRVVTFSGTHYELGDVDPQYEAAYPNAKARVMSQEGLCYSPA